MKWFVLILISPFLLITGTDSGARHADGDRRDKSVDSYHPSWNVSTETEALFKGLVESAEQRKPFFSAQLFYNYYRRNLMWKSVNGRVAPLKPDETELSKVIRYDVGRHLGIYGIDLAHGAKSGWFSGAEAEKRRTTIISIVKKAWKEHRAIPSASWHLENPYVPHAYFSMGNEGRGAVYNAARTFFLRSGETFNYPKSHVNVPKEIMDGVSYDEGKTLRDEDGYWLPSAKSTRCGIAKMEGTEDLAGYDNPTQWFEAMLSDMCSLINEFVDEEGTAIPVILRLYHEPETKSAWWGYGVPKQDYISFFRYTVEKIREKCLNKNILFAYCKDRYWNVKSYGDRYPGDSYVDLVGFDDYTICTSDTSDKAVIARMRIVSNFAKEHGKVAALFETGNKTKYSRSKNFLSDNLYHCITAEGGQLGMVQIWSSFTTEGDERILNDYRGFLRKKRIQTVKTRK